MNHTFEIQTKNLGKKIRKNIFIFLGIICSFFIVYLFVLILPPKDFPGETFITVERGTPLSRFSLQLEQQGYIRSAVLFQTLAIAIGGEASLIAGDYALEKPESTIELARRFTRGVFKLERVRVRLFEGESVYDYAVTLEQELSNFNKDLFLRLASDYEGYLFPDTYTFFETANEQEILLQLKANFNEKTQDIREKAEMSERSFEDVVIMASILEREANNNLQEKQMIAGILWRRIDINMPLQVDAPFKYYLDKGSFDLTLEDLRSDHEYNTYTRRGLTPTPIGNPGRRSLMAALEPIKSRYLFFLHDFNGNIRYGVTHDDHVANKRKYLRR